MFLELEKRVPRKVLRAGGLFFSRSFHSISQLVFSLLAARLLTVEDHGYYAQYFARMLVFQAILEAGLQYSIIRYLSPAIAAGRRQEAAEIIRASLRLKLYASAIVLGLVGWWMLEGFLPFRTGIFPIARTPAHILHAWFIFLAALGLSFFSYFDSLLVSFRNYRSLMFWIPATGLLRLIVLSALFFLNGGAVRIEDVLFAFMAGSFLAWPFYFIRFDASLFFEACRPEHVRGWWHRLLRYNRWILLASFFAMLSDYMEILVLQKQSDVALYNAARMPMQGFAILLATMQSLILPRMTTFTTKGEYVAFFKRLYSVLVPGLVLLLPGFWIFRWFIPLWFGEEYLGSVFLFYIVYPGFLLRMMFAPLGAALFALDEPRIIAWEAGLRMAGGVVANAILIPLLGVTGAAVSSVVSQLPGWIFLVYCYIRYYRNGSFPSIVASSASERRDLEADVVDRPHSEDLNEP